MRFYLEMGLKLLSSRVIKVLAVNLISILKIISFLIFNKDNVFTNFNTTKLRKSS